MGKGVNSEDLLSSLLEKDKLRGEGGGKMFAKTAEEELPSLSKVVDAGVKASERLPSAKNSSVCPCIVCWYVTILPDGLASLVGWIDSQISELREGPASFWIGRDEKI